MALSIGKPTWDQIRRHGEETYPHECCGVLVGEVDGEGVKVVRAAVRCGNQRSNSPHNRYEVDPRELVRIQREARERAQDIVGFYHSHPDHPARWSQTDLAEAHWTGCSYVITSVMNGIAVETNSFNLTARDEIKSFDDEEVQFE
jgi:proteasome lid subunit RPN8/RPN11